MSQFLVHFTKSPKALASILATGCLRASGPYGFSWFRKIPQVASQHSVVCLSEIPIDKINRLTRRHGHYGIAFPKSFIKSRHGARVWYVDQRSAQEQMLTRQMRSLSEHSNYTHPLWSLTPFIDMVVPGEYEWDWEREWRVQGDLYFDQDDVSFFVTPEGIEEEPELVSLDVHPDFGLTVAASPQPLAEYVEGLVQEFFKNFVEPVNCLSVDEGEFVWLVPEWETQDAVEDLFSELNDSIKTELVEYFDNISWSWARSQDVASLYGYP